MHAIALLLILTATTPRPGLTLPCRVVEVVDGDTVTVELTLRARVRLLDCWAPELRQPGGRESRQNLQDVAGGRDALLRIPLEGADRLDDVFSFGRVLGRVYVGGRDMSDLQVRAGHATKTKGE